MPWRALPQMAVAVATRPYPANAAHPDDLPLELGDDLYLIEQGGRNGDWYRGYLVAPPSLLSGLSSTRGQNLEARVFSGVFPASCVRVREYLPHMPDAEQPLEKGGLMQRLSPHVSHASSNDAGERPAAPVPMLKIGDEAAASSTEPLVDEISSCMREWHSKNLHELLLARQYQTLEKLHSLISRLDVARKQLLLGLLTDHELQQLREETVWDMVNGNKLVGNEVVVRDPQSHGRLLVGDDSPVELAKLQSSMSLLDRPPHASTEVFAEHHIAVTLKSLHARGVADPIASMCLCKVEDGQSPNFFTELYTTHLDTPSSKRSVVFSDLTSRDFGLSGSAPCQLFLVIGLYANQPLRALNRLESSASSVNSSTRVMSPVKSGRPSLMWKQFGRSRSNHNQAVEPKQNERPSTSDSLRPGTPSGATSIRRLLGWAIFDITKSHPLEASLPVWTHLPLAQSPALTSIWKSLSSQQLASEVSHSIDVNVSSTKPVRDVPQILRSDLGGISIRPRSDIYVRVREISLPSRALLSHPEHGTVPGPGSMDMQQLQLTLEVRRSSGQRIEKCIVPSADAEPLTAWRTCAVARDQAWSDSIKLCIPDDQVADAHLIMSIADAPNFPFALCWLPLWTDEAFIKDGTHSPLLYAYDKTTSGHINGRGAYLDYAWNARIKREESVVGTLATLQIETKLCSTSSSQDKTLLGLRNWRSLGKIQSLDLVRHVGLVSEVETTKMFKDVLDSLFGILVSNAANDEFEDAAFGALVSTLNIVHDRRFDLARRVDEYVERDFDQPYAAPGLMQAFTRLLTDQEDPNKQKAARATFKVGHLLFKFIFHARRLQQVKETEIGASMQSSFRHDLLSIFGGLEALMRNSAASLVGNKALLMQNLPQWVPEFRLLLSQSDILELVDSFLAACDVVEGKLTMHKLVFLLKMADFFTESRILQLCDAAMDFHSRESIRICTTILCANHNKPGFTWSNHVKNALQAFLYLLEHPKSQHDQFSLLFPRAYPFPVKPARAELYDEALLELGAFLALFAYSAADFDLTAEERVPVIEALLVVLQALLSGKAFPKSWLSLYVHFHKMSLRMLERIFVDLSTHLLPLPEDAVEFETEVWQLYLETLLMVVRSDVVALETFPEQKRRAVWKIAGDIRDQGAQLLQKTWWTLGWESGNESARMGGYQVQYVPVLVSPIVALCLSVHDGLRREAIRIFQAMVISEWDLNEDLSVIQAEMIDCLDKSDHDDVVHKTFIRDLMQIFGNVERSNPLWQAIHDMISTIDELLVLLVAVHSRDSDEPRRVWDTLQLMEFLKDMHKEDMFIRYVHQLADTQRLVGHQTQAGLALQLHAKQYSWDNRVVRGLGEPKMPQQTSFERKEQLFFDIIKCFEDGAAWVPALTCYRELCQQYELVQYDYIKLARGQRAMATIYESIARGDWQVPRYFKVHYRGLGFPASLQDRKFVYEGDAGERLSSFIDRIRQVHPLAHVLGKQEPQDLEGQYLDICPVGIYRDLNSAIYQQTKLAPTVREFLATSQPHEFSLTSKRHAATAPVEEQWLEKTVFTVLDALPTLSRRSEIVETRTEELSAVQTALERTTRKTAELAGMERRACSGDELVLNLLSEGLSASVDDKSPSSVSQYRRLLPVDIRLEALFAMEDEEESIGAVHRALRIAILDHVHIVKRCLMQFSQSSQLALQQSLSQAFDATYAPELELMQAEPEVIQPVPDKVTVSKRNSAVPAPLFSVPEKPVRREVATPKPQTNGVSGPTTPTISPGRMKKRLSLLGLRRVGRRSNDPVKLNGVK